MNHDEMRRTRGIAIRREGEHDESQRGEKTKTKHHDEEKDEHEELRRGERANCPWLTIVHDEGECI